jgi:hypothetical protein
MRQHTTHHDDCGCLSQRLREEIEGLRRERGEWRDLFEHEMDRRESAEKDRDAARALSAAHEDAFKAAAAQRDDARGAKDGAYRERDRCVALAARLAMILHLPAWLGRHIDKPGDPPWDEDWRNIVFIELPSGQVSWHIHDSEVDLVSFLPRRDDPWDGHDTAEKYRRCDAPWPRRPHSFVPWIEGVNRACTRCGLAETDAAGVPCIVTTPAPFPPGALQPKWEGDPAHIQTVSATDRQIDGFNERPGETEWIVYFTNPATGATAQMFARMRPYPEVRTTALSPAVEATTGSGTPKPSPAPAALLSEKP